MTIHKNTPQILLQCFDIINFRTKKWQKMRGDDFPSAGNDKKYVGTISQVWEMAKNVFDGKSEIRKIIKGLF